MDGLADGNRVQMVQRRVLDRLDVAVQRRSGSLFQITLLVQGNDITDSDLITDILNGKDGLLDGDISLRVMMEEGQNLPRKAADGEDDGNQRNGHRDPEPIIPSLTLLSGDRTSRTSGLGSILW